MTIFQALAELENENRAGALCTIVRSNGSTPEDSFWKSVLRPPFLHQDADRHR